MSSDSSGQPKPDSPEQSELRAGLGKIVLVLFGSIFLFVSASRIGPCLARSVETAMLPSSEQIEQMGKEGKFAELHALLLRRPLVADVLLRDAAVAIFRNAHTEDEAWSQLNHALTDEQTPAIVRIKIAEAYLLSGTTASPELVCPMISSDNADQQLLRPLVLAMGENGKSCMIKLLASAASGNDFEWLQKIAGLLDEKVLGPDADVIIRDVNGLQKALLECSSTEAKIKEQRASVDELSKKVSDFNESLRLLHAMLVDRLGSLTVEGENLVTYEIALPPWGNPATLLTFGPKYETKGSIDLWVRRLANVSVQDDDGVTQEVPQFIEVPQKARIKNDEDGKRVVTMRKDIQRLESKLQLCSRALAPTRIKVLSRLRYVENPQAAAQLLVSSPDQYGESDSKEAIHRTIERCGEDVKVTIYPPADEPLKGQLHFEMGTSADGITLDANGLATSLRGLGWTVSVEGGDYYWWQPDAFRNLEEASKSIIAVVSGCEFYGGNGRIRTSSSRVSDIVVADPRFVDNKGISIGSSFAEVRRAFPKFRASTDEETGGITLGGDGGYFLFDRHKKLSEIHMYIGHGAKPLADREQTPEQRSSAREKNKAKHLLQNADPFEAVPATAGAEQKRQSRKKKTSKSLLQEADPFEE